MADLVSFILNESSDTWIFLSLDGFLVLDEKKLTDLLFSILLFQNSGKVKISQYVAVRKIPCYRVRTQKLFSIYRVSFPLGTLKFSGQGQVHTRHSNTCVTRLHTTQGWICIWPVHSRISIVYQSISHKTGIKEERSWEAPKQFNRK